jgi:catechol 2,3-dioxygenase-like lactoylglutathione lyase family enzyme
MFKIGKLFHLTHVVGDLDAVDRWYDEIFKVNRFYRGYEKLAVREASLVLIGDVVMEPVMLGRVAGAEQSPIGKFQSRFGHRFHSIAWYVDSIAETCAAFGARHQRLYNVVGKVVTPPIKTEAVWTHPRETQALLEFAAQGSYTLDPRLQAGWTAAMWRDEHPLGIVRASHITVTVGDLAAATTLYGETMGGKLIHRAEVAGRKRSVYFAIGEDTVIEAAEPLSASSAEGQDFARNGAGVYSITFQSRDLPRAAEFLKAKGQRVHEDGGDLFVIDRADAFGMTIGFSGRAIPGDPR